jgi:hypothetical protein
MSQKAIMNLCHNALLTLGAVLIMGLGFLPGAAAQSGEPIPDRNESCADRRRGVTSKGDQYCA